MQCSFNNFLSYLLYIVRTEIHSNFFQLSSGQSLDQNEKVGSQSPAGCLGGDDEGKCFTEARQGVSFAIIFIVMFFVIIIVMFTIFIVIIFLVIITLRSTVLRI